MAAKKKTPTPAAKKKTRGRKIKIRMYNVGFGDSFLIRFPTEEGERKVLIDCGVHRSGPGPRPIRKVAQQIIEDVKVNGKASIDVVIATHRHADHVAGFDYSGWKNVEVREVWLPWTENYDDPQAVKLLDVQSKAAKKLAALRGVNPIVNSLAENALVNAAAMKTLHSGFAGKPRRRYLPTLHGKSSFTTAALPGVTVHVMGPSRDQAVIRDMDPKAGHSYFHLLQLEESEARPLRPFRELWSVLPGYYDETYPELRLSEETMDSLVEVGKVDALLAATSLEDSVNGTSLMLMFNMGDAYLLFPGDAQWGTWDAAMKNERWRDLLAKTTFYKVGHHGSHNATPTDFIEDILKDSKSLAAAMVCTRTKVHPKWDIPRMPLLDRLREKTPNVIRSDDDDTPDAFERGPENYFVDYEAAM